MPRFGARKSAVLRSIQQIINTSLRLDMNKKSSVIVLTETASDQLILTRRSERLHDHPGEICFPGGHWQQDDINLWTTALRELQEELGIEATRISLISKLNTERTLKGTIITPWIASIDHIQPYKINPEEVDSLVLLPMIDVRNTHNYQELQLTRQGVTITTCQYTASQHVIWGATARIMRQLARVSK